jgi:signal transduction histidine kinase
MVQECLHNIVKHSGADAAKVELSGTDNEILLRVWDSGIGFDVDSPTLKKGLGLISMRERLRLVGGTVSINSALSQGTHVQARVPFGRRAADVGADSTGEKRRAAEC